MWPSTTTAPVTREKGLLCERAIISLGHSHHHRGEIKVQYTPAKQIDETPYITIGNIMYLAWPVILNLFTLDHIDWPSKRHTDSQRWDKSSHHKGSTEFE